MNSQNSLPDRTSARPSAGDSWRRVCRREAYAAADLEEREAWNTGPDDSIPFHYRWEHVQHVVSLAIWLAGETGADREIVEAAAWLHDVRKRETDHAVRGAESAEAILRRTDFPQDKIAAVADAIRQHEGLTRDTLSPLEPLEAAVLWDADKLSKIGVQALMVAMSSPYVQGLSLAERRKRNQEFFETVLSKTVASMNTDPAHRLAEERYRQNIEFMSAWARDEVIGD